MPAYSIQNNLNRAFRAGAGIAGGYQSGRDYGSRLESQIESSLSSALLNNARAKELENERYDLDTTVNNFPSLYSGLSEAEIAEVDEAGPGARPEYYTPQKERDLRVGRLYASLLRGSSRNSNTEQNAKGLGSLLESFLKEEIVHSPELLGPDITRALAVTGAQPVYHPGNAYGVTNRYSGTVAETPASRSQIALNNARGRASTENLAEARGKLLAETNLANARRKVVLNPIPSKSPRAALQKSALDASETNYLFTDPYEGNEVSRLENGVLTLAKEKKAKGPSSEPEFIKHSKTGKVQRLINGVYTPVRNIDGKWVPE